MNRPTRPAPAAPIVSRRTFVAGTGALAATVLAGCATRSINRRPKFARNPFTLGVASGDPLRDSVVLWTRLAPEPLAPGGGMAPESVEVTWTIAEDEAMTRGVRSGKAIAEPSWGHSVHVEVDRLQPERWYWYRFRAGDEVSGIGRTRTAPKQDEGERLRFAFASCQHYEDGLYTAYEHMAREDLDLVIHLGDYIYEGGIHEKRVRKHNSGEIFTLDDYRARYALYKADPHLQAAHAAAPWIATWDDHEVANDYAADIPEKPVAREEFLRRRAAGYQAYFEHMPLRRSTQPRGPDMPLYRDLRYGRLATFHVLDTRQYRTDQPLGAGNKTPTDVVMNPEATLLGTAQREWLFAGLKRSPTVWNILAQQIMVARVDRAAGPTVTHSMDQWPGYEFERRRLLRHFVHERISNPVVLTGDIHANYANNLIADFEEFGGRSVAVEFVGTSISSGGNGRNEPANLAQTLAENPFVKFHNTERGYVRCELTAKEWRTDYRTVPFVDRPGAPLQTRASFRVEAGRPELLRI